MKKLLPPSNEYSYNGQFKPVGEPFEVLDHDADALIAEGWAEIHDASISGHKKKPAFSSNEED